MTNTQHAKMFRIAKSSRLTATPSAELAATETANTALSSDLLGRPRQATNCTLTTAPRGTPSCYAATALHCPTTQPTSTNLTSATWNTPTSYFCRGWRTWKMRKRRISRRPRTRLSQRVYRSCVDAVQRGTSCIAGAFPSSYCQPFVCYVPMTATSGDEPRRHWMATATPIMRRRPRPSTGVWSTGLPTTLSRSLMPLLPLSTHAARHVRCGP
mmetsp:Transcript_33352/g.85245  ORF Transcript_33352/g.85245 Transcript_33352/m.85245 type:complete len:213 (+) Transcript_33352:506-1144(+)